MEICLDKSKWRDPSIVRIEELSKIILVRESLGKERWVTEGIV
jgi:hypothetical protein